MCPVFNISILWLLCCSTAGSPPTAPSSDVLQSSPGPSIKIKTDCYILTKSAGLPTIYRKYHNNIGQNKHCGRQKNCHPTCIDNLVRILLMKLLICWTGFHILFYLTGYFKIYYPEMDCSSSPSIANNVKCLTKEQRILQ